MQPSRLKPLRLKLACVDRSAAERLTLQASVENAYEQCRTSLALARPAECVLLAPEELESSGALSAPEFAAVILGPALSTDDLSRICRRLRDGSPELLLVVFLSREAYSLETLRRLERYSAVVFSADDPPARLVHELLHIAHPPAETSLGTLVVLSGAKGGVGTTSVATGLAHAAHALGRSSVLLDLSADRVLPYVLRIERTCSTEFAASLADRVPITPDTLERCMARAANGLELFLSPAGGSDTRDRWLRSPESLEVSLAAVDLLREQFDLVLVDTGGADGLLPYGLQVRADIRAVVTSNEPVSASLLQRRLFELQLYPGAGINAVLINLRREHSLTRPDIERLVTGENALSDVRMLNGAVAFDRRAEHWMGTGNSFYTEAGRAVQFFLRDAASQLLQRAFDSRVEFESTRTVLQLVYDFARRVVCRHHSQPAPSLLLPAPLGVAAESGRDPLERVPRISIPPQVEMPAGQPPILSGSEELFAHYQPPRLVVNE